MLDLNISRVRESRMIAYSQAVARMEEGMACVMTLEGGVEVVAPSTGVPGEHFVGLALNNRTTATYMPMVEDVVVPSTAPYTVTLARTPNNTIGLRNEAGGAAETLTVGTPSGSQYGIAGRVVTFPAGMAGQTFRAIYQYTPTIQEIYAVFGEMGVGDDPSSVIGATGVLFHCDKIFFTNYDPLCDWTDSSGPLFTGPNGTLTLTPGGTQLPDGCYVVSAPSSSSPFLGIRLKA